MKETYSEVRISIVESLVKPWVASEDRVRCNAKLEDHASGHGEPEYCSRHSSQTNAKNEIYKSDSRLGNVIRVRGTRLRAFVDLVP